MSQWNTVSLTNISFWVWIRTLQHSSAFCIMFFFGRITHVTMFLFNKSSKMYNVSNTWASSVLICVPEEAQVGETLYIFDDLLKRNIVTCVICPKKNIIQIDLACRRNFTVTLVRCMLLTTQVVRKYEASTPWDTSLQSHTKRILNPDFMSSSSSTSMDCNAWRAPSSSSVMISESCGWLRS